MIINNAWFGICQAIFNLADNSMAEFRYLAKYLRVIQKKTFRNDPERLHFR